MKNTLPDSDKTQKLVFHDTGRISKEVLNEVTDSWEPKALTADEIQSVVDAWNERLPVKYDATVFFPPNTNLAEIPLWLEERSIKDAHINLRFVDKTKLISVNVKW